MVHKIDALAKLTKVFHRQRLSLCPTGLCGWSVTILRQRRRKRETIYVHGEEKDV